MPFEKRYELVAPILPAAADLLPDIEAALAAKWLSNGGRFVERLERRIESVLGFGHAVLTSSCTLALVVALRALGRRGEVITPSFSFAASAHAIRWAGLEPVLAEVDRTAFNLDAESVGRLAGPDTAAVLALDAFGVPCDLGAIRDAAGGAPVVCDCAHSFGSERTDAGAADMHVFSLHATKTVVAGEGGVICTDDDDLALRLRRLINFGFDGAHDCAEIGINAKMPELSAILAYHHLNLLEQTLAGHAAWAQAYRDAFRRVEGVELTSSPAGVRPNHQYAPIRIVRERFGRTRDEVRDALRAQNVITRSYFSPAVHEMSCYAGALRRDDLAWTEELSRSVLCLPIHPGEPAGIATKIANLVASLAKRPVAR